MVETRLYGAVILVAPVGFTSGDTPFVRWGDLPVIGVADLMLAAATRGSAPLATGRPASRVN